MKGRPVSGYESTPDTIPVHLKCKSHEGKDPCCFFFFPLKGAPSALEIKASQ